MIMDMIKTHNKTIEKALRCKVVSENISDWLELDEILYLNRLKLALNCFSIETTLNRFLNDYPDVSNDYKYYLNFLGKQEDDMKMKTDTILFNALKTAPDEVINFISLFLIENLYQHHDKIEKKCKALKNSQNCVDFIKNTEKKLGFDDAFIKLNIIRYIKKKFSYFNDYYYIDLINAYTNSTLLGLLYAIQDR